MTKNTPIKPEPLSIYVLHSPAEKRKHAAEVDAYNQAVRAIEHAKQVKAQAEIAERNRPMTDEEYFQMAVNRKADQDAMEAEAAAIRHAAELEKIAYEMSSPAVADIMETSEFQFLKSVVHWAGRGYVMHDQSIQHWGMGLYHVQLSAPAVAKKAGK